MGGGGCEVRLRTSDCRKCFLSILPLKISNILEKLARIVLLSGWENRGVALKAQPDVDSHHSSVFCFVFFIIISSGGPSVDAP